MKKKRANNRVKNFSKTVLRSVTDLRFFREVREKRVSEVVGYIASLLILFWIIPFSIIFFSNIRSGLDIFIGDLRKNIPAETRFRVTEGKFSNTLEAPAVFRDGPMTVIVNTATSTLELGASETGIVIGTDSIVSKESPSSTKTVTYEEFPEIDITRQGIDEWIGRYARWVILLVSVVALLIFIAIVSIGYAAYILAHGFLFWLAMKILRRPMKYSSSFIVSAYAATMPIIVKAVFMWSDIEIGATATYLYWVLLAFIIYDMRKQRKAVQDPKKVEENEKSYKEKPRA